MTSYMIIEKSPHPLPLLSLVIRFPLSYNEGANNPIRKGVISCLIAASVRFAVHLIKKLNVTLNVCGTVNQKIAL